MTGSLEGSCLCGRIGFTVTATLAHPAACHCVQCRKQTGHYFAAADVPKAALAISGAENISWYQSSPEVRRGFCSFCGSTLFWERTECDWIAIAMGAFDTPTGTRLEKHIFVAEKGDYYQIADGLPQDQGWSQLVEPSGSGDA